MTHIGRTLESGDRYGKNKKAERSSGNPTDSKEDLDAAELAANGRGNGSGPVDVCRLCDAGPHAC